MGQGSTDLSYFLGGLALMTTAISVVLYSQSYLPSRQIKILDEILQETRRIYDKSAAEDLLPSKIQGNLEARLTQWVKPLYHASLIRNQQS